MAELTVTVYCVFADCDESKLEVKMPVPDGWSTGHGEHIDHENGLCPKHAAVREFLKDQCPGCVGGWGDCPLFNAFAYSDPRHRLELTDGWFTSLESGICPARVNGTLMVNNDGGKVEVTEINMSTPAVEGGKAMAVAIRAYVEEYPTRSR